MDFILGFVSEIDYSNIELVHQPGEKNLTVSTKYCKFLDNPFDMFFGSSSNKNKSEPYLQDLFFSLVNCITNTTLEIHIYILIFCYFRYLGKQICISTM